MDSCLLCWMVVRLKVQAPPVYFYWLSANHHTVTTVATIYFDHLISETWQITTVQLVNFLFCCIFNGICTFKFLNEQLSNVVDGINNPVAYPVGPIGRQ